MQKALFRLLLISVITLIISALPAVAGKKLHTIGDSTMQEYATDGSTDKRGWAQMLQQFFNTDNITVNNRGKSGASSKSFYQETAYWPTLVTGGSDAMQSGDFLIIQFAHNDEKNGGADGDTVKAYYTSIGDATSASSADYRGTTASGTFKQYIRAFIDEAKAMGVKPIVVAPICRKYFTSDETDIRRNGQHDLGDSFTICDGTTYSTGNSVGTDDDTYDYVQQAKNVAYEYDDVPFIDMTEATRKLYLSYGLTYCTNNLFCSGDNTHPAALGATLIAREFAQLLKSQAETESDAGRKAVLAELAADVIVSSEITFNPTSGDMGKAYQGQSIVKEFNVSAFSLDEGESMTLTASDGFLVSTDKQNYYQSITLDAEDGNVISSIYIKVTLTDAGTQTGTLTAATSTLTTSLDLTAEAISLSGGTETTILWPLTSGVTANASDTLTCADETLTGLSVKSYSTIGSDDAAQTMQRLQPESGSWGVGEIDEVSTRYAEFCLTVPADYEFAADKISYYVSGSGGSAVSYHAYYSTNKDFSTCTLIDEKISMTNNTPVLVEYTMAEQLEEGQSLYIRLYPWYNNQSTAATGKYLCVSQMSVHGTVSEAGGVAMDYEGTITYDLIDSDPVYSPEEMTVGLIGNTVSYGSLLTVSDNGGATWSGTTSNGTTQTKIANNSGSSLPSSAVDGNTITYTLTPEDGVVFMPSKVSFQAARYGTDGGTITATISGQGAATICEANAINRSGKSLELTTISSEVSGVAADADNPLLLKISVLGLGNTKSVGINSIVIEGSMQGTLQQSTKYALTTTVSPTDAGTISSEPNLDTYKEGTDVTLTATNNFGYSFKEWQLNGETIGNEQQCTITMDADKTVTAVYNTVPIYTVSTSATNDAERSLGSVTLAPNDHDGRYEEGTEVTATAEESRILKFMQWTDGGENAGTSATRTVTVNNDMTLVADFEVQDFIAVFDASATQSYAYSTSTNYPFAADVTWDADRNATASVVRVSDGSLVYSQSTGTPVVRNREGVVLSGINGLYQNGYDTRDIAWQYQFSTKDFSDVVFYGDMAAKNMAAVNYKAQYSIDGETFTDIDEATWQMTANAIKTIEIALPAEANGQDTVTLRITGTGDDLLSSSYSFDSEFDGLQYTSHSEAGVGNVYVMGTAAVADDDIAPTITSTLPVAGSSGASASGQITISFDERIQEGDTSTPATLNGQTLTATWNTRSVSFAYRSLSYGETYSFYLPAGYVTDRSGNAAPSTTITFTVMQRQQPDARIFDAVVDKSLDLAHGETIAATETMPKQYRYIQDAIDDAPDSNAKPYLIFIKEGYYDDGNVTFADSYGQTASGVTISGGQNDYDDCKLIYINKTNIHLIGQGSDKVTIATDRLAGSDGSSSAVWYHVNAGAALEVMDAATDFFMQGITLDNENWTVLGGEGPQALAANIRADRVVFDEIQARSYQDTWKTNGTYNRQFVNNSTIEGGVDFIYGSGDVWFENCVLNINRSKGGYIVAPNHPDGTRWGYVFNNTRITTTYATNPEDYQIYLGRPWHEYPITVFLNTTMEVKPYDGYWYPTMGGLPKLWAVYNIVDRNGYQLSNTSIEDYYYTDSDGNTVSAKAKNYLTDDEAAEYTVSNVMAGDGTSGTSGVWNPLEVVEKTTTPALTANGTSVTWEADPYAICYVVMVNSNVSAFTTDAAYDAHEGDTITVQSVNEHGALSSPSPTLVVDDDATTGIHDIQTPANATDDIIYNTLGQRVNNTHHGICIRGERKYIRGKK